MVFEGNAFSLHRPRRTCCLIDLETFGLEDVWSVLPGDNLARFSKFTGGAGSVRRDPSSLIVCVVQTTQPGPTHGARCIPRRPSFPATGCVAYHPTMVGPHNTAQVRSSVYYIFSILPTRRGSWPRMHLHTTRRNSLAHNTTYGCTTTTDAMWRLCKQLFKQLPYWVETDSL